MRGSQVQNVSAEVGMGLEKLNWSRDFFRYNGNVMKVGNN